MSAFPATRTALRWREAVPLPGRRSLWAHGLAWVALWLSLWLSTLAIAATGPRWAHQADVVFSRIATADLRDGIALAQDGQGLMWIGSQIGLTRWDGYRTRAYPADPQNPAALHDNFIQALHTDAQGRLWVGTVAGGLARYDAKQDAFVNIPGPLDGPTSPHVWTIGAARDGGLWICTSAGLDHLDVKTDTRHRVPLGRTPGLAVRAMVETPDGTLWVSTEEGLLRRAPGATVFVDVPLPAAAGEKPSVIELLYDTAGRLWIGTDANGAFVIEPNASEPRRLRETTAGQNLAQESIRTIVEVEPGEVWLGAGGGGGIIAVDTRGGWATRRLRNHPNVTSSLADDDVSAIYRDRGGVVWVATTMALNLHDTRVTGIHTFFGAATGERPVTSPQVPSVMAAADGRAWVGLGTGGGVDILDPVAGRVGQLRADPARPKSALPKARVLAMAEMPSGDVFIGTRQGLYHAAAPGSAAERVVTRVDLPGRATDTAVWSMVFDAGLLWFGGPDGLWAIEPAGDGVPVVRRHESAKRIGGPIVTSLLRGRGNTLWVGTSVGVTRVEVDSEVVEKLVSDTADPTALPGNHVGSMLLDDRDRLWVASFSAGIQILERRDADGRPRFRRIGARDGLPSDGVDALLAGPNGQVWASTDGGLVVIDPRTYAVRAFKEPNGAALMSYWVGAGARTASGELLFGGQGGLTVVQPEQVPAVGTSSPLVVSEIRVGSKRLLASRFNSASPIDRPHIEVTADEPDLSVEFAALDFAWANVVRYSYRLVGYNRDWIETDASHRVAAYTNLPPGDYTLQLRSHGHDDRSAPTTLDLPVRVLPAWYQTIMFRFASALVALLLVGLLVQVRTRVLQRRQRELQTQVALRTAELQESQRQLELIAYTDPLTGLENRRRFNESLQRSIALALRNQGGVTLLLIDLDHFKTVNDTLGHDAGDAMLLEVARRIVATARASDHVARLGGDEFAVILPGTSTSDEVNASCSRILHSLMQPFDHRGNQLRAGASIGAASCPEHALEAEALYKRADLALYAAKRSGRNTWRLQAPAVTSTSGEPLSNTSEVSD